MGSIKHYNTQQRPPTPPACHLLALLLLAALRSAFGEQKRYGLRGSAAKGEGASIPAIMGDGVISGAEQSAAQTENELSAAFTQQDHGATGMNSGGGSSATAFDFVDEAKLVQGAPAISQTSTSPNPSLRGAGRRQTTTPAVESRSSAADVEAEDATLFDAEAAIDPASSFLLTGVQEEEVAQKLEQEQTTSETQLQAAAAAASTKAGLGLEMSQEQKEQEEQEHIRAAAAAEATSQEQQEQEKIIAKTSEERNHLDTSEIKSRNEAEKSAADVEHLPASSHLQKTAETPVLKSGFTSGDDTGSCCYGHELLGITAEDRKRQQVALQSLGKAGSGTGKKTSQRCAKERLDLPCEYKLTFPQRNPKDPDYSCCKLQGNSKTCVQNPKISDADEATCRMKRINPHARADYEAYWWWIKYGIGDDAEKERLQKLREQLNKKCKKEALDITCEYRFYLEDYEAEIDKKCCYENHSGTRNASCGARKELPPKILEECVEVGPNPNPPDPEALPERLRPRSTPSPSPTTPSGGDIDGLPDRQKDPDPDDGDSGSAETSASSVETSDPEGTDPETESEETWSESEEWEDTDSSDGEASSSDEQQIVVKVTTVTGGGDGAGGMDATQKMLTAGKRSPVTSGSPNVQITGTGKGNVKVVGDGHGGDDSYDGSDSESAAAA
ncbi:unnamed protein product [Amoebophrya sp. A120]|nr:unnamed protein product [Amoebophrya sp. A120]|eukprot:GSA120T00017031001.1